ncbi:hypothetical protein [Methylomonas sp. AM2-LC]|uniref:hypothetical protein n=1 Tax=Methylomonas sp. AM2-LC TaxID=3153301 RepID=UPI0032640AC2
MVALRAYDVLCELIYTHGDKSTYIEFIDSPARFEIKINVDIFDGWKMFLIDLENKTLFICQPPDKSISFYDLKIGDFDAAVSEFSEYLNNCYERTIPIQDKTL